MAPSIPSIALRQPFIEEVLDDPVSRLRVTLIRHGLDRSFDKAELEAFVAELESLDPPTIRVAKNAALEAFKGQDVSPDISSDESQLFWAATFFHWWLDYLENIEEFDPLDPRPNPVELPVWRNMRSHPLLVNELFRYADTLKDHFSPAKTRIRWGYPLSWFNYTIEQNLVNLDLFYSLAFGVPQQIGGLSHSRAPGFHEIGHAALTMEWPEPFNKNRARILELEKKAETSPLTKEEMREHILCSIDCMLWGQLENKAEDNPVNRFAVLLGQGEEGDIQDYGHSIKYTYALLGRAETHFEDMSGSFWAKYIKEGTKFLEILRERKAFKQFKAILTVIGLSVPVHEGLIPNTKEGWQSAGLDWESFLPDRDDQGKLAAINDILSRCDRGLDSISNQQPMAQPAEKDGRFRRRFAAASRWWSSLAGKNDPEKERILAFNKRRNLMKEDLWRDYIAPIHDELRQEALVQTMANLALLAAALKKALSDLKPGEGTGLPSPVHIKPPAGKPGESVLENAPVSSSTGDGEGEDKKEAKVKEGDKEKDANKAEGNQKPGNSQGEKPAPLPQNDDKGKTIGEVIREANDRGEQRTQGEAEAQRRRENQFTLLQAIKYDFPEGNWTDYLANKKKLEWLITAVSRALADLRRKQFQETTTLSPHLEIDPQDGDIDRFDMDAHRHVMLKLATGQAIERDDLRRFHPDITDIMQTTPEVAFFIDGSGSMKYRMDEKSTPLPIDIAISTGVAFYEGIESLGKENRESFPPFLFYAGIWGPANPRWLMLPGMKREEAGKNFDRFRKGLNSVTHLAPSLYMLVKKLKETPERQPPYLGALHILIASDGDIQDRDNAEKVLGEIVKIVHNVTVDVLMINKRPHTEMEAMLNAVAKNNPGFKFGITRGFDIERLPLECLRLLEKRLGKGIIATPAAQRRKEFSRVSDNLEQLEM